MTDPLDLLHCPECHGRLTRADSGARCLNEAEHLFPEMDGILSFGQPPAGKYDSEYATRYAALWAYGSETLHSGWDESLYRTVASLVAEEVITWSDTDSGRLIVDAGCGVGRVSRDCATLVPGALVLGFDASIDMLEVAHRVVCGTEPWSVWLPQFGFGELTIAGRGLANAFFMRADVRSLPLEAASADIALSVNIVDRLEEGPESVITESYRILRVGGRLIFTDPLNWAQPNLWATYSKREAVLDLIGRSGFRIDAWFDDLLYREILDHRGSYEEWRTLVVQAVKVSV